MANITVDVNLKSQLQELNKIRSTPELQLSKKQQEAYDLNRKGAEAALSAGDLKEFRKYFNNMAEILKKASLASGQISKNLQDLTKRQEDLNRDINKLKEQRDNLKKSITSSKGEGTLSKDQANKLYSESREKGKIFGIGGKELQEATIINKRVQDLAAELEKVGKNWSQITNEMAQKFGFKDKQSAQAAHRFYNEEQNYITKTQSQIATIDTEIGTKETQQTELSAEIEKIEQNAPDAAKALEEIYAAIVKIKNITNTEVTNQQGKATQAEAHSQESGGADSTPLPETKALQQQQSSLNKAFKQFTMYHLVVKGVKKALSEAVQTVKELDKYLTEQAMVTGKTRKETYNLIGSYQDLAMQCGATTKEIAQVATEYMKQGKSTADALVLTEAAVKAAKVAGVSVGNSVNYLTTALNGFQLAAEDAMKVSDKFAAIAAASATDYDELAIALSKVASQANLAGMSIDYTTALLTKGLETTREAPETMGTALKTIIARMRELGDYGETLDDGMDINNVESQLKYVGIALRDSNGELRSTEDVLDELGQKWDTLDKNQQAAVAKALAGTRQQARLIAMMEDYERVTELQEISQRSAGATAAQAAVYMEGMEGALNRVQVAWEKVVMTFTDSEVIIDIVDGVAKVLDYVAEMLENPMFSTGVVTMILMTVTKTIGMKLQEQHIAHEIAKIENDQNIKNSKAREQEIRDEIENIKMAKNEYIANKNNLKLQVDKNKLVKKELLEKKAMAIIEDKNKSEEDKLKEIDAIEKEIAGLDALAEKEKQAIDNGDKKFDIQIAQKQNQLKLQHDITTSLEDQGNTIAQTRQAWSGYLNAVKDAAGGVLQYGKNIINTIKKIGKTSEETKTGNMSTSASVIPMVGWIIALVIEGAALINTIITVVGGIMAAVEKYNRENENSAENTAKEINEISNEIYKLNEQSTKLKQTISAFEALDNKVIKTKEDIAEMNDLLDGAADALSSENQTETDNKGNENEVEGTSQQDTYAGMYTEEERLKYLKGVQEQADIQADAKRQELLQKAFNLRNTNTAEFNELMNENSSDGEILQAQSAIRATAYDKLYDEIDELATKAKDENLVNKTEELTSSLVSSMSALDALSYVEDGSTKMKSLVDSLFEVTVALTNANGEIEEFKATEVFTDEDKSIVDRIEAFEEIEKALAGDEAALNAFKKSYSDWAALADEGMWSLNARSFISKTNMSVDEINKMFDGYRTVIKNGADITEEEYKENMRDVLGGLNSDLSNLEEVVKNSFWDILDTEKEFANNWDILLQQVVDSLSTSILDMGQNMEKFKNSINNFYETATKWGELSESEKTSFISDNSDLFKGDDGKKLLEAFENGNYEAIEDSLGVAMNERRERELDAVTRTLNAEKAKKERNEAYIAILEEYEDYLKNTDELYQASLELRLEQEKNQLDEYKELLEKEKDALVESLEKRKEAYQEYFDSLKEEESEQEYEDQVELLTKNISKLAASSNMADQKTMKEMETELANLQKERLQELREKAQEAILENMDDQVEQINDKFDKLLENNQAMLAQMRGELDNPVDFISQLITNKVSSGATGLELSDYLGSLQSIYGSQFQNGDLDNINIREENNQIILNVNGSEVILDTTNETNLYNAITKALTEIGLR